MYMDIVGFTKHHHFAEDHGHPEEDSFGYVSEGKIVVAVADGIYRDPLGMRVLPERDDEDGLRKASEKYPRPSPAKEAADLFCKSFVEFTKNFVGDGKSVINILRQVNEKIRELNKDLKVNYLENDFAACVGSCGVIYEGYLYWGFVADCGVCVFDRRGELKFRTECEGPRKEMDKDSLAKKGWSDPEWRVRVRKHYRNNSDELLSYGAFTGEKKAESFFRTGKIKLNEGDYVFFYSDGFELIILGGNFDVVGEFEDLENYFEDRRDKIDGSEGTLVAFQVQDG